MQIKKITVKSGGLKGLDVERLAWDKTKDGRPTRKTVVEKKQIPVHVGLEKLIKSLRVNLLEICRVIGHGTTEDDAKFITMECDIVGIEFNEEMFVLSGTVLAFDDKPFKLKTPKVDMGDQYAKFGEVMDIIKQIAEETKEYLNGSAVMSSEDIVNRWIEAGKAGIDRAAFDGLDEEAQKEFCKGFLEDKYGAMILMNDDVDLTDEDDVDEQPIATTFELPAAHTTEILLPKSGEVLILDSTGINEGKTKAKLTKEDKEFLEANLTEEEEEF